MRKITRTAQRPAGKRPSESFESGRFVDTFANKPRQMSANERKDASGDKQIQDAKTVFVFAADELEHQMNEGCERAIDVANVAIQNVALTHGPRKILKNALVSAKR